MRIADVPSKVRNKKNMPLKCTCPRCGKLHRNIDKKLLGKKFQCDCGKVMRLGGAPGAKKGKTPPAKKPVATKTATADPGGGGSGGGKAPASSVPDAGLPRKDADFIPVEDAPPGEPSTRDEAVPLNRTLASDFSDVDNVIPSATSQPVSDEPVPSDNPLTDLINEAEVKPVALPVVSDMESLPGKPSRALQAESGAVPESNSGDDSELELNQNDDSDDNPTGQSFEVLDDSEEDVELSDEVISLSDIDVVGGLQPVPASTAAPVVQTQEPVTEWIQPAPVADASPLPSPGSQTPTSMNPIYKAFGPPPPVIYPAEPPVPDGPAAGQLVTATSANPHGFQTKPHSSVSVFGLFSTLVSFAGVIFALWLSYTSYQVVADFIPGAGRRRFAASGGSALALIFGIRMLGGIAMLVGCGLYLINEGVKLTSQSEPLPFATLFALASSAFVLFIEFGLSCFFILDTTKFAATIGTTGSIGGILVSLILISIVPIAMIVFALCRSR